MAEFQCSSQNSGPFFNNGKGKTEEPIQSHTVIDSPDKCLYSEIQREFSNWFFSASLEDFDDELLNAYLEELDELMPLESSFDSQVSLKKFHERFNLLFGKQEVSHLPKHKSLRQFKRFIAVIATISTMMVIMITAQAFGLNVLSFFARWTNDIFFFGTEETQIQEARTYPMAEGEKIKYKSINDALVAFGVNLPLSPKWIPDHLGEWEVTGSVMPNGMCIFAFVKDESNFLTWEVSEFSLQDGPEFIIEKDAREIQQYESHGQIHYIMEDNGCYKATWTVDNIQCIISGFITEEELIKIIDSIYEVV